MRFRPRAFREEPEINFIPLIDVLLVILIFLMVTTTYSRFAELQINLPTAEAERSRGPPQPDRRRGGRPGALRGQPHARSTFSGPAAFSAELRRAAGRHEGPGGGDQRRRQLRPTSP